MTAWVDVLNKNKIIKNGWVKVNTGSTFNPFTGKSEPTYADKKIIAAWTMDSNNQLKQILSTQSHYDTIEDWERVCILPAGDGPDSEKIYYICNYLNELHLFISDSLNHYVYRDGSFELLPSSHSLPVIPGNGAIVLTAADAGIVWADEDTNIGIFFMGTGNTDAQKRKCYRYTTSGGFVQVATLPSSLPFDQSLGYRACVGMVPNEHITVIYNKYFYRLDLSVSNPTWRSVITLPKAFKHPAITEARGFLEIFGGCQDTDIDPGYGYTIFNYYSNTFMNCGHFMSPVKFTKTKILYVQRDEHMDPIMHFIGSDINFLSHNILTSGDSYLDWIPHIRYIEPETSPTYQVDFLYNHNIQNVGTDLPVEFMHNMGSSTGNDISSTITALKGSGDLYYTPFYSPTSQPTRYLWKSKYAGSDLIPINTRKNSIRSISGPSSLVVPSYKFIAEVVSGFEDALEWSTSSNATYSVDSSNPLHCTVTPTFANDTQEVRVSCMIDHGIGDDRKTLLQKTVSWTMNDLVSSIVVNRNSGSSSSPIDTITDSSPNQSYSSGSLYVHLLPSTALDINDLTVSITANSNDIVLSRQTIKNGQYFSFTVAANKEVNSSIVLSLQRQDEQIISKTINININTMAIHINSINLYKGANQSGGQYSSSFEINRFSASMSADIYPVLLPSDAVDVGDPITVTSSNPSVLGISTGTLYSNNRLRITGLADGSSTLTFTCGSITKTLSVVVGYTITAYLYLQKSVLTSIGEATEIGMTAVSGTQSEALDPGSNITSSNSNVARPKYVPGLTNYMVEAYDRGTATITATAQGLTASAQISVQADRVWPTNMTLKNVTTQAAISSFTFTINSAQNLEVSIDLTPSNVTDKNNLDVSITTSNSSVASVSANSIKANGTVVISPGANGSATIGFTISTRNGNIYKSIAITVSRQSVTNITNVKFGKPGSYTPRSYD